MSLTIKIETDNAAFDDGLEALEVSLILRTVIDRITESDDINIPIYIRDSNGNKVGVYEVD